MNGAFLRMLMRPVFLVALSFTMLTAAVARADSAVSSNHPPAMADRLLVDLPPAPRAALEHKKYTQAETLFELLYKQNRNPIHLFYLGMAAEGQGRRANAVDLYRRYLEALGEQANPDLRGYVESYLKGTDVPLSEISVNGPARQLLYMDNHLVGELPLPGVLLVDELAHVYQIASGAMRSTSRPVTVPPKRTATLTLNASGSTLNTLLHIADGILLHLESPIQSVLHDMIERAVAQSVKHRNGLLISRAQQQTFIEQQPGLRRCLVTRDCREPLVRPGELSYVLELRIEQESTSVQLALRLFDISTTMYGPQRRATCLPAEIAPRVGALAAELLEQAAVFGRGTLSVRTRPPGATVEVDDTVIGVSPHQREALVGTHRIALRAKGYASHEAMIEIPANQEVSVDVELSRLARRAGTKPSRLRIVLGSGMIAGGVLIGAFGVGALTANGRCTDFSNDTGICESYFDIQNLGIGLTVPGALLTLGGILALTVPIKKSEPSAR